MASSRNLKFASRAIHAGQEPDPTTGSIMPPVYQTSTYAQESPGVFKQHYDYGRTANPTRTALEANLAALEGGKHGICFASGCAATTALLHTLASGDHVVMSDDVYGGTFRIFDSVFAKLGIVLTMVDMTDANAFAAAFQPRTKLVWLETPTNPLLKIVDLELARDLAKKHQALLAVDNTFATPFLQNPLDYGVDVVCHSSTKYLGGHSDLLGGVLIVNDAGLAEKLHFIQNTTGAVPAPWDCFLLLRSTKTLHVRLERHCANAGKIAEFLAQHAKVERLIYPGLPSHPQYALATKQMRDAGGILTMLIKGDLAATKRFLERVQLFALAESLGGVESLIEHPAIMTHASIPPERRKVLGIGDNLVRLSVGIEDVDDLITDLDQALN